MPHRPLGTAKITSNEGGGLYKITQCWWDATASQYALCATPVGWIEETARDIQNRTSGQEGQYVFCWQQEGRGGKPELVIDLGGGTLFPVKVTNTSGSAGDRDNPCTYVYTIKDLAGTELGTNMTPAKQRPPRGQMVAPANESYGLALYDAGVLVLWDAGEVPWPED